MKTLDEVKVGLVRYIDCELIPKMPPEIRGGLVTRGLLAYVQLRGDRMLAKFLGGKLASAAEVFTDDGVDVEFLRDWLKATLPPEGYHVHLPVNPFIPGTDTMELVFKPPEIDLIYDYVMGVR